MVLRFGPGTLQLGLDMSSKGNDEQCIWREESANRRPLRLPFADGDLSVDWKDQRNFGVAGGSLSEEIEVAKLRYVIAPEFESYRLSHSEAVDVEDPAPHTELSDVFDHGNTLETDLLEVRGQIFGPAD